MMIIGTVTPPATMQAGDLFVIVAAYRGNTTLSLASTGGQTRASGAKGLVRVTVLAGLALMTASSTVRIAVAQGKGGGDVTGPHDCRRQRGVLPARVEAGAWRT